jgi:hypothetical protein
MSSGKDIGFWVAGLTCYGGAVLIVNFLLLLNFNAFNWQGNFLIGLMCAAYWVIFGLESVTGMFPVVAYLFSNEFKEPHVWLSLILCVAAVSAMVLALRFWEKLITEKPDYSEDLKKCCKTEDQELQD